MHQTRQNTITRIPIKRKGTKYVACAIHNPRNAVPVLIAVRDMLKLVRTLKEFNELLKDKLVKINGRIITDFHDGVQIFNILTIGDKHYTLSITKTNKFFFEETKDANKRLCKITSKRLVSGGKIQYGLHDGAAIIGKNDLQINDSLYLDDSQKVVRHIPFKEGSSVFVFAGRYVGLPGKVISTNGRISKIKIEKQEVSLPNSNLIVQ